MYIHKICGLMTASLLLTACSGNNDYNATGTFEGTEITISAESAGRILSLNTEEGNVIDAGQTVGVIDTVQLNLQLQALKQQQNAILAARPDVQTQVAALRKQIAKQKKELKRVERMENGGAATSKQTDDAKTQLQVLEDQLAASLQSLESNRTSADHNAAAMEIQMQQLEDKLAKCHISSPIRATVLVKYAEAGDYMAPGKPILKVADMENIHLRAYVTSEQLSEIKLGQEVKVIADFGGDDQIEYPGTIAWIADRSEFTPKGIQTQDSRANLVYAVKVAVKNDGKIKLGLFGGVKW